MDVYDAISGKGKEKRRSRFIEGLPVEGLLSNDTECMAL